MNAERRRQIAQLYRAVLARDPAERAPFLADACGADHDLRETLESLLAHQSSAEHFPDVPDLDRTTHTGAAAEATATTLVEDRRLGAYRILREVGRGGMGSVYLAERVDETFHKRVAIKVEDAPEQTGTTRSLTPEGVSEVRDATPVQLRRQLEGDLDRMLLKALDKDPARRYRSVEQFSEDVRRHLAGLPVAAREDTYRYRAGKFVRRHPVGVAAAIIITIAQQVSFITTIWEIRDRLAEPLAAGTVVDVRPELVSLTCLALALLVGAVYVSRAQALRAGSAMVGGAIFSVFVTMLPISMRWRRFVAVSHPAHALLLLYAIGALYGAIIALAGWRIARRFAWRGLAVFVIALSIGGPMRERLYLSAAHLAVMPPGAVPWIASTLSWACALLLSHSIMRLIAGPARDDRLTRRWWNSA